MGQKEDLYMEGVTKYGQGDLDGALEDLNKALEMDPQFAEVLLALGHVYEKKEMYDQALEYIKKAVEITPDDPLTHSSLSMMYQRKGMIPQAEEEMAISVRLQESK